MGFGFLILAGGRSSRMGQPKHLLDWGGKSFLETLIAKGSAAGGVPYLSCNEPIEGFITIPDGSQKHYGPISGIAATLRQSRCHWNFCVPVDTPQIPPDLILTMLGEAQSQKVDFLPLEADGQLEPLIAVFSKSVLPHLETMIRQKDFAVRRLSKYCSSGIYSFTGDPRLVQGMNTWEDYDHLRRELIE